MEDDIKSISNQLIKQHLLDTLNFPLIYLITNAHIPLKVKYYIFFMLKGESFKVDQRMNF